MDSQKQPQQQDEYDPYNPHNQLVTKAEIEAILKTYNVHPEVSNMTLYRRAFVHESYVRKTLEQNLEKMQRQLQNQMHQNSSDDSEEDASSVAPGGDGRPVHTQRIRAPLPGEIPLASKSNQRLEFLGDGILEAVVKFWIYRNFPQASEGFMTDIKINMVKNQAIGRIAAELGLNRWMLIERSLETKLRNNEHQLGCLFESFIGAMYLDYNRLPVDDEAGWFGSGMFLTGPGFQMVQLFLERVFERHVDRVRLITENNNFKRILQEKIQQTFKVTPVYVVESQPVKAAGGASVASVASVAGGVSESGSGVGTGANGHSSEGYRMGVYLCLGQPSFGLTRKDAVDLRELAQSYRTLSPELTVVDVIQRWMDSGCTDRAFFFLGEGENRVKKEAEQLACKRAMELF
jgi:dsRNA-specific ribonuclease